MRARELLTVASILILATLACGPSETPTLAPGVVGTAVAQTVQVELATRLATDEPTGTPTPIPTDTPPPTATDTPVPPPPPATDTPVPANTPTVRPTPAPTQCTVDVAPEFAPRFDARPEILFALGCPTDEGQQVWTAEARFQHGRMFWQQDTGAIHILYDDTGTFQVEPDQYAEGDPEDACPEVGNAPAGLFKPVRGFNWHWCNTDGVRTGLGWAVAEEAGYSTVWQTFEHGYALQSLTKHIFVFYDDGTWGYVE